MANPTTEFAAKIENGPMAEIGSIGDPTTYRRAFITAPYSTNTSILRQALEDRGFAPFELDDLPPEGRSIPELLEDCLEGSDLVIAVTGGGDAGDRSVDGKGGGVRDEVQFSLGYAVALKKRILVLVPTDGSPLFGLPCLFFDPQNRHREVIDQWLDLVLNSPPRLTERQSGKVRPTIPLGPRVGGLLARIRGCEELSVGDLEEITRTLFEASEVDGLVSQPELITFGREVDMVVMSDDFLPWFPSLLPVELDVVSRSFSELEFHQEHLSRWVETIHARWALLIYHGVGQMPKEQALRHPNVLAISIEHFIEALQTTSLGDFLRHWRNRRVRGKE